MLTKPHKRLMKLDVLYGNADSGIDFTDSPNRNWVTVKIIVQLMFDVDDADDALCALILIG